MWDGVNYLILLAVLISIMTLIGRYYNLHLTSKKMMDSPVKKRLMIQSCVYSFAILYRAVFNIIANVTSNNNYDEINA